MTRHGSCVAFAGQGVLLRGPSGSGKSDLALRLIEAGALLVADDQVIMRKNGTKLIASPPATIAGRLEVRGLGIVNLPYLSSAPLSLICDLVAREDVPRLPEAAYDEIADVRLPCWSLHAFDASAVAKIRLSFSLCR